MDSSAKISFCVVVFVCFLLILDGTLVLYACLLWPRAKVSSGDPLFVVGVVTFVVCFTLPFVLVVGYVFCTLCCEGCCRQRRWSLRKAEGDVGNTGCDDAGGAPSCLPRLPCCRCCCGCGSGRQSPTGSGPSQSMKSLHRLDLLPPSFVSAHFGDLVTFQSFTTTEVVDLAKKERRQSCTSEDLLENHYARRKPRSRSKSRRVSALSCESVPPLPRVNFIRLGDGKEVPAIMDKEKEEEEEEGATATCSRVTTQV